MLAYLWTDLVEVVDVAEKPRDTARQSYLVRTVRPICLLQEGGSALQIECTDMQAAGDNADVRFHRTQQGM